MQQQAVSIAQRNGDDQERTPAAASLLGEEQALVTVVQCLLDQAGEGGLVSLASLRGRVPPSKLLQAVRHLERIGILSPTESNNQRTIVIARAEALLADPGNSAHLAAPGMSESCHVPPLSRLTEALKQALLLLLQHGHSGEHADAALLMDEMGIGHNKAFRLLRVLSEQRILGQVDPTTRKRPIDIQRARALLAQHGVQLPDTPEAHPQSSPSDGGWQTDAEHAH